MIRNPHRAALRCEVCGAQTARRHLPNPAPYCEEHTLDAPHPRWIAGAASARAHELARVARGGEPDLDHAVTREVLAAVAGNSGSPGRAARELGWPVTGELVRRVMAAVDERLAPPLVRQHCYPQVDPDLALACVLALAETAELDSPLVLRAPGEGSTSHATWWRDHA